MNPQQIQERLYREGLQLADNKKRILAYAIDDILISLIFVVIFWNSISQASGYEQTIAIINEAFFEIMTVKILYHTFFVMQYGATIGKIIMKIRVLQVDTMDIPGFMPALTRAIFRIISEIIFYFGFLLAFFDPNKQTLHDKVAKCVVIDG
ncbi:MAG: RDD family protein [Campylobacterota bacterium]